MKVHKSLFGFGGISKHEKPIKNTQLSKETCGGGASWLLSSGFYFFDIPPGHREGDRTIAFRSLDSHSARTVKHQKTFNKSCTDW